MAYIAGRSTYFIFTIFNTFSQQSVSFASPSVMLIHLTLLVKGMAIFLCLYPFPDNIISWVAWFVFIASLLGAVYFSIHNRKSLPKKVKLILLFALYSSSVMSVLFIITTFATGWWAIEYLISMFYLFVLSFLSIASVFERKNIKTRMVAGISIMAYLVLSLTLIVNSGWKLSPNWGEKKMVGQFLAKNHLYFGYGSYFGTQSPLFGLASDGVVTGRHISSKMGMLVIETGNGDVHYWYDNKTSLPTPQFIVFSRTSSPLVPLTRKTFGNPNNITHFLSYTVYVYNNNLLPRLLSNRRLADIKWQKMNIDRNIKGINKVCKMLNINPLPIEHIYTLLSH